MYVSNEKRTPVSDYRLLLSLSYKLIFLAVIIDQPVLMQVDHGSRQLNSEADLVRPLHVHVESQEADAVAGRPTSSLPPVSPISEVCHVCHT